MLPFLTAYDPVSSSEGTLDPLGLGMIADQLATILVPGIRERMQKIRFLTAMVVGAIVTNDLDQNPNYLESPPFMAWEWLVVESLVRSEKPENLRGVAGSRVARNAISKFGYLDHHTYLKNAETFGFHGVYKRLANHSRLLNSQLNIAGDGAEELIDAWAKDNNLGNFDQDNALRKQWSDAVRSCLKQSPVRTRNVFAAADFATLAELFHPQNIRSREKKVLIRLLLSDSQDCSFEALRYFWEVFNPGDFEQYALPDENWDERLVLRKILQFAPQYEALIDAIMHYERFARAIINGFDKIRFHASQENSFGYSLSSADKDDDLIRYATVVNSLFQEALTALSTFVGKDQLFEERFRLLAEVQSPTDFAVALCGHHEKIQREKSDLGKNSWFDRVGTEEIMMRRDYRKLTPELLPDSVFLHQYRTRPLFSFYRDLYEKD